MLFKKGKKVKELEKKCVERKIAEEELKTDCDKLQKNLDEFIQLIVFISELNDPFTAGHQRQVTQLACAIAKEMGLSEKQFKGIYMASRIHDIGKMKVPAEILNKPAKLTETELNIIKTHPQAGYELLKHIEFQWPIAKIVLQHHEKCDGSGYPAGLGNKEILLEEYKILLQNAKTLKIPDKEKNVFSLGGRGHYENPISDILSFFIDPNEEHGFNSLFLRSIFEAAKSEMPLLETVKAPIREVRTDLGNRIDLLVEGDEWVLTIENKIRHDAVNPFDDYTNFINNVI